MRIPTREEVAERRSRALAAIERRRRRPKAEDPTARLKERKVEVVAVPQYFPTPVPLAIQLVELAELRPGMSILEPSAGMGRLIDSCACSDWEWSGRLVAVDDSLAFVGNLKCKYLPEFVTVVHADFLEWSATTEERFDRVVMNPPFANAADIKHVQAACRLLNPEGRVAAIVAGGPRQERALRDRSASWERLPPGSFAPSGTNVSAVLCAFEFGAFP